MGEVEREAALWAATGETGVSSKAMLATFMGKPPKSRFCYPHDGGDLGRCIGLLDTIPQFRKRLPEMRAIGPEWAALVDHWSELERRWRANDAGLYKRMKAILNPIERTNPNLIQLDGGSLHFGK